MRSTLRALGFQPRYFDTSIGRTHALVAQSQGPHGQLVLLHGFAASGAQFLPLLIRLKPKMSKLIVPDLPAHGFSDAPEAAMNSEGMTRGLFETLDAAIGDPVTLFGTSMGGWAALRYALARPSNVKRLILCSPGGASMNEEEIQALQQVFNVSSTDEARVFVDRLLGRRSPLRFVLAPGVQKTMSRPSFKKLLGSVEPQQLIQPEELSSLKMPILMIWGQQDGILPRTHRDFFVKNLPEHAQIVEPDGLGHSPHFDQPQMLVEHIERFLAT